MRTVQRLVHHEADREAPDALILRLREIDPSFEVVYFGEGWWWVGAVRPNAARRRIGDTILAEEAKRDVPNPHNVLLGRLAQQGFAFICRYRSPDGLASAVSEDGERVSIVEDIRARHHAFHVDREQGERVFRSRLDHHQKVVEESRGRQQDRLLEGRDVFRSTLRRKLISIPTPDEVGHFSTSHGER